MQNSRYITALFSAVIIFFMTAGTVYAQFHDAKADSLAALAANAPDSVADGLNNDICWRLRNKNPEIAVRFGLKAIACHSDEKHGRAPMFANIELNPNSLKAGDSLTVNIACGNFSKIS